MIIESSIQDQEAFRKFRKALQDLTLRFPLAGFSLLGRAIGIREGAVRTMCTDGRHIWYDPKWIHAKSTDEVLFDLLHEWLHVFFNHVARRGGRDPHLWNEACDYFVVAEACRILSRNGETWTPPKDGYIPPQWTEDLTVEEIYNELEHRAEPQEMPQFGNDMRSGPEAPAPAGGYTPAQEKQFYQQFVEELKQAKAVMESIQQAANPKLYGTRTHERLKELTHAYVPWQQLLRSNLIASIGQDHVSWARPNRKYYPQLILPRLMSLKEKRLMVAVDVSASVGNELLGAFASNVQPAADRANETVIVTFDATIREEVRTQRPKQVLKAMKFLTGTHGGTAITPVLEAVKRIDPTSLVVLTDGHLHDIPSTPPSAWFRNNVLWVYPENGSPQNWGRNYRMKTAW